MAAATFLGLNVTPSGTQADTPRGAASTFPRIATILSTSPDMDRIRLINKTNGSSFDSWVANNGTETTLVAHTPDGVSWSYVQRVRGEIRTWAVFHNQSCVLITTLDTGTSTLNCGGEQS